MSTGVRMTAEPIVSQQAVLTGPRTLSVQAGLVGPPGAGQVRIRLEGCGVCASSLPVWEGRPWFSYPQPPGAPGHEGWGRIESVGHDVVSVRVGDRVAFLSSTAFAEYEVVDATHVVVLPELLDEQPFPGEPLGCVMNILARADIRAGQTVAVVGAGFIGLALVALATRRGARVVALSRRTWARAQAEALGAVATFPLGREFTPAVMGMAPAGFERVIEAAGTQEALDVSSALGAVRSRLVISGYHQDGTRTVDLQSWNWRGLDVINAHERDPAQYRAGMDAAISAVISGQIDPQPLFTHQLPLSQLAEAFELAATRPDGFVKALVTLA